MWPWAFWLGNIFYARVSIADTVFRIIKFKGVMAEIFKRFS